ncbi:MAG: calcium-binding protein, partial [Pseudomonadota bacterium]
AVSAIHLHNAPVGINGPIVQDTLVDAGGVIDAAAALGISGADVIDEVVETDILSSIERVVGSDDIDTVDLNAFDGVTIDLDVNTPQPGPASQEGVIRVDGEVVAEVADFENVRGSGGDDLILGNNEINVLEGLGGNDSIHSFGGADTIDGGDGIDTALFSAGGGVIVDLDEDGNAIAQINAPEGALIDTVLNFENINGSNNVGSANGGADVLSGNSGANQLNGQAGDDVLNGEGGNDILIGGAGSDTFTFEGNFGNDVINDFEVGIDRLDFSDFGDDFADEVDVKDVDNGTLLTLGDSGSVLLAGVNDFDFEDDFVS